MVATLLPLALVVGLSPLPILPAVLLLMTPRARGNGSAYLVTWLVVLTALVGVMVWLGSLSDPEPPGEKGVGWLQLVTGVVFLLLAAAKWVRRPRAGQPKKVPKWMAALDGYGPAQSARLAGILAAGNPKNLAMSLAAGAEIALLAESATATATAVVGFVLVGSVGVAVPIIAYLILGQRAEPGLARAKGWLDRNSTALGVGVLLILGVLLVIKAIPAAI